MIVKDALGRSFYLINCAVCGEKVKVRDKDQTCCHKHRKYSSRFYVPKKSNKVKVKPNKKRKIVRKRVLKKKKVRLKKIITSAIIVQKPLNIEVKEVYSPSMKFSLRVDSRTVKYFDTIERYEAAVKHLAELKSVWYI